MNITTYRKIIPLTKLALACALFCTGSGSTYADDIRIVDCGVPVKSPKRGLCLNKMSPEDFMALSPSVSWWYNWYFDENMPVPEDADMSFYPMAWGNRENDVKGLDTYLKKHNPPYVLAINEPNLKGQAFISPKETADLYRKIKRIADRHNIPVIGPNMALGSPDGSSITAYDPIEKKKVTYTFQDPFLNAFFHYLGKDKVEAVASHTYGNFAELKWMVESMHGTFKLPVWVTEFAHWHASSDKEERDYLIQSVDLMERLPYVKGYAWFKERVEGNPKLSLLGKSGELTALGETYVNMPVHDPEVYYRLPGRLQAESYVTAIEPDITATNDEDGFLEMRCLGASNTLTYNVFVEKARNFELTVRLASRNETKVEVLRDDKVIATINPEGGGWTSTEGSIELPAGQQTLTVRCASPAKLNWFQFD